MSAVSLAKSDMSDLEWRARCDLAAAFHILHHFGWTDLLDTHLSVRAPGEPNAFLMNGYLNMFEEITASSLVKINLDGEQIGGSGRVNKAGTAIHRGVYIARPDINSVMHTHTRAGAGVSLIPEGLRPISQDALHVFNELAYHPYGEPTTQEECEALGRTCAQGTCIILRNHGLLSLGPSIPAALKRLYKMERACELELTARMVGVDPVEVEPDVRAKFSALMKRVMGSEEYGAPEWEALKRIVDRKAIDYRR